VVCASTLGIGTIYSFKYLLIKALALLVAGMSGVLSGSLNAPIAAAIIGTEIFGAEYAVPATLSSIISFQIARSSYLYDAQNDS
tara:strand:+ start:65 stop:316 length:252 start_codon:yes stop_codon:yes gene_type:complete